MDLTFKSLHLDGTKSLHQFVSKNPDIKKGKDEKPIQLTVIVGVQAFKAAIQANNENMTHGLQKLHDMLIGKMMGVIIKDIILAANLLINVFII